MADLNFDRFIQHLERVWKSPPCPMCEHRKWNVENKVFQLTEFHEGGLVIGGPLIPVVPVTCVNCGNTILVNAVVADIVQQSIDNPTVKVTGGGNE